MALTASQKQQLIDGIREIAGFGKFHMFTGKAESVDETKLSMGVDIDGDGLIIPNVRLRAIMTDNTKGWWVIPKIGTKVTIGLLEGGTDYVLINASEIDKFFIKIGDMVFQMDSTGIVMNGGNNGGLVKVDELKTQLDKLSARVDGIIDAFNLLPTDFVAQDGGSAAFGLVNTALTLLTNVEDFGDLANPDVKH